MSEGAGQGPDPRPAPLMLTSRVVTDLRSLRRLAASKPLRMAVVEAAMATEDGARRHHDQMRRQSVKIPVPGLPEMAWRTDGGTMVLLSAGPEKHPMFFRVTFSVEVGHPAGTCRHMSVSINRPGRIPSPECAWRIGLELGFEGGLTHCQGWTEEMSDGVMAVNLIQPVVSVAPAHC